MKRFFRCLSCVALIFLLSGFSTQPLDERKAQDALPKAQHALWKKLTACAVTFDVDAGEYRIAFTPEVRALDRTSITIDGFMLPIEAREPFTHFLLSLRIPTCPFCPPGEANEVIEVFTKEPFRWDENLLTLSGRLELSNTTNDGLFFRLNDAIRSPR